MKIFKLSTLAIALTLSLSQIQAKQQVATQEPTLLSFVEVADATGETKKIYDEIKAAWGFVPIVMKQYSLNPELLKNQWEFYQAIGKNKNFDPKMQAMMRMIIAEKSSCTYCIGFNEGMLANIFKVPLDEIANIKKDPKSATLDPKQKEMLLFILKSVHNPHKVDKTDIATLKSLKWSDKDIFEGIKMGANMLSASILIDTLKIQKDY